MNTAIIYTYPADYLMAGISARVLAHQGVRVILAIDKDDPPFACDHAEIIRTSFDRRHNLNGADFILGNLSLMRQVATGPYTIKLDSDTLLLDARAWLEGKTEVAVGLWGESMQGMNGACYALRTDSLPEITKAFLAMEHTEPDFDGAKDFYMEDKVTGLCASRVGPCHFSEWARPGSPFCRWKPSNTPAWFLERRKHVVIFDLTESFRREAIAREMARICRHLESLPPEPPHDPDLPDLPAPGRSVPADADA